MKNLFLLLIACVFSIAVSAQDSGNTASSNSDFVSPSSWFFGGVFSINGTGQKNFDTGGSENGPTTSSFSILPQTAYVLNRMLALGIALGYSGYTYKYLQDIGGGESVELKNSNGEFIIQPQLSYYIQAFSRLYVFATLYVGMGFGNSSTQNYDFGSSSINTEKNKLSSIQAGIALSFMYFLSAKWALSLSYGNLYYRSSTETDSDNSDQKWRNTSYGLDLTLTSLQIGVLYYLASTKAN